MALVINGRFLTRPITGVERYGRLMLEVIAREWPNSRVIVPRASGDLINDPALEIVRHGKMRGHIWEQLELPHAVGWNDILLSPANSGPVRARRHVPVVHDLAFLHHPEWFDARYANWYKFLMPRLLNRAQRVITVSGSIREEITAHYGVEDQRLAIVPPFVPATLTSAPMKAGHVKPYCLVVASLDPRKGLDRILRWYTSLGAAEFDLLIVGRTHRAFAAIERPGARGVHLLTDVDDARLAQLYRGAIALVQASRYEGFGLPILEAMALDCPVVASALPVLKEQFDGSILLANMDDPPSIVKAMAVLNNEHRRHELIARGRSRAATFTLERTAVALHAVLDPLLVN